MNKTKAIDIGVDISTSCVGFCVLETGTGNLVSIFSIKLSKTKLKDVWDKASYLKNEFSKQYDFQNWVPQNIYVEEAHMKFTPGLSSAKTLFTLAMFNGITSYMLYDLFGVKPTMVNVRKARAKLGLKINYKDKTKSTKEKVFDMVLSWNPSFPWGQHKAKTGHKKGQMVWDKENYDMADAWVICRGGQLM